MPRARFRSHGLALLLMAALLVGCRGQGAPSSDAPGFCADWFHLADEAARLSAGQVVRPDPAEMRTSVDATVAYLKSLSDSAPEEIRSDFGIYAQWWTAFAEAMARVDYDFSRIPGDPALQQAMRTASDPAFTQASTRVNTWVQEHCIPAR